jgi:DNA-binding transcriptional regulator YhcF (GntR family)
MMLIHWAEAYIILKKEGLVVASKETGLEVNNDKTKYTVKSREQNAERSHNLKMDNSSFERVEQFKHLEQP